MARSALASRLGRTGPPRRAPATVSGTATHRVLPPRTRPNPYWRSREYRTPAEVDTLMGTAKRLGRHGHREATLIQLAYRHGLRVAELLALRWDQVDLRDGLRHVRRRQHGLSSPQPFYGVALRALRQVVREYPDPPSVVVTERTGPLTDSTFRQIVARAGAAAPLGFPVHPHMRRHATGCKLANDGHDTRAMQPDLGPKNMQYPVR